MKKWREPYEFNLILDGILLFMLIVQLTTTSVAFGVPVDLTFVFCLSIYFLGFDRIGIYINLTLLAFAG